MTLEENTHYKSCYRPKVHSVVAFATQASALGWGTSNRLTVSKVQRVQMSPVRKWFRGRWNLISNAGGSIHMRAHTHAVSALSGTHTSFPETYLLSHTPRLLSNPQWWRLMAALRACWAPPVKARGPPGQLPSVHQNKGASRSQIHHRGPPQAGSPEPDTTAGPSTRGYPSGMTGTPAESDRSRLDGCVHVQVHPRTCRRELDHVG